MNKDKFFIGIGPAKTGSTWMYRILQQHSEVQMPPIKELNYFSIKQNIGKTNVIDNLFSKKRLIQLKRKWSFLVLKNAIKPIVKLRQINWENIYWVFTYFCLLSSDIQYKKIFPKNKVSGDISTPYSRLSEGTIEKVKHFNPNAKIIIGLRNPVERTWSATKMRFLKLGNRNSIPDIKKSVIFSFFNNNDKFDPNDYVTLIKKWQKHFPKEQILIYYFDELQENPQKLFNRICEFLEIEPIEIENIDKKVNKGIVEEIPAEYEQELIKLNYKYIEEFAQAYPNKYSLAWLEKYKDYE